MSDVQFNEENVNTGHGRILYSRFETTDQTPKMVGLIMKFGLAKDESRANYILIGIIVVCWIVFAYFIFFR
jgi:hypothetical protein